MATRNIGGLNINFTPTQDQTQLWNMIGRDAGQQQVNPLQQIGFGNIAGNAVQGFFDNIGRRASAAENAIGTTLATPISFVDTARENANIDERQNRWDNSLNDIARKYGYADRFDYWDKLDAAEQAGNTELLNKMRTSGIDDELKAQAAANANEAKQAADNWRDYRENSYVGKKINQDQGKFLGDSLTTLSTGADIAAMTTGLPMGVLANTIQGGVEGVANELSTNGFENFDWGRAGQQAASGALAGAATAGLNKALGARAAAKAVPGAKAPGLLKSVAQGAGRGALSGAVGGAVGAGTTSALSGQDIGTGLANTLSGAVQGTASGAFSGGVMGGVNNLGGRAINAIDRKFGTNLGDISQTGAKWQKSGENFNERLTNTLNSGESAVGNWINGKQSKTLGRLGTLGNTIRDYTDQGLGKRASERNAFRDSIAGFAGNEDGIDGILANVDAYRRPGESNYQAALRYVSESGDGPIYYDDFYNGLKDVYGDEFNPDIYLNKNGSYKIKGGENYAQKIYSAKVAQMLANEMDAREAGKTTLVNSVEDDSYNSKLYPGKEVGSIGADYGNFEQRARELANVDDMAAWDKLAQDAGYDSYGEVYNKIFDANPGIKIDGKVVGQWLDQQAEAGRLPQTAQPTTGTAYQDNLDYETRRLINGSNKDWNEFLQSHGLKNMDAAMTEWHKSDPSNTSNQITDFIEWARNYSNPQVDSFIDAMSDGNHTWNEFVSGYASLSPEAREQILSNASDYGINTELQKTLYALQSNGSSKFMRDPVIDAQEKIDFIHQRNNAPTATQKTASTVQTTPQLDDQVIKRWYNTIDSPDNEAFLDFAEGMNMNRAVNENGERVIYFEDGNTYNPSGWRMGEYDSPEAKAIIDTYQEYGGEYEPVGNQPTQKQSNSPTTLGGWLKKAGNRAIDDLNNKGVGLSLKDVGDQYSDDINNMFVNRNDMLDDTVESPETELYRQLTGGTERQAQPSSIPTSTGDAWDNLAREYGYNTYNDAIRAFAAANPNTPISAGAVTTWLDSNEGNYNPNQVQITQNATMPTEIQEAEIVPSKTSRETKLKYAQGKELLAQYGAVDQPMARATKAPETFQKLAEMGFTKPGDVEKISNAITGSNGAVSKLTKSVIASAKPVNTFDGETAGQTMDDFIKNSIEHNMLSGTNQGKAVKRGIDAYLRSLPSHADGSITMEDSAADAFKVVQGLEARAAELEGRGGSTYHRATTEDVHQAAVLKDVANLLKDRIYAGANVKAALTPEVAQELKAFDPKNTTWAKTVDDFVSSAKTAQDLRSFQKPFVRANRYIDNQYVQAATAGGRMAASAGELPAILPTTKAGVIKQVVNNVWNSNPAHRARAAAYGKLAENAAANAPQNQTTAQPATSNPQTAVYDLLNRNNTLNVIGRNIGEDMGRAAAPVQDYVDMAMNAESGYVAPLAATTSTAGSLEDLANTGATTTTTPTTLAESLGGGTGNRFTGQFSNTGNDQVDLLGRAMELAMAADDADAFAALYGMYNNALSSLEKSSSDLTAAQQTQLAKFNSADDAINELEALYNQAGGGKGPIAGNLQSVAGDWGWDSGARTYNQMAEGLVNQIAQAIGKTDSLNTEGEVQRALKLVPSLTDDAQTAQNKLRTLREMLAQTKANYYGAYGV